MSVRGSATAAVVAVVALAGASAGCGSQRASEPAAAAPGPALVRASLHPGDAVPVSTSATAVRVTGRIAAPRRLTLDRATLARLGLVRVELYEPFKKRWMTFEAVPLASVVALARLAAGATTLHAAALNDYSVDLPLSVARARGVLLAIADGRGAAIPVAQGGPFRVVFVGGAPGARENDYWIWSLASIVVR